MKDHISQDIKSIKPFTQVLNGTIILPGSKSISNRALILAALAKGRTVIKHFLWSEDTQVMLHALRQLGFMINVLDEAVVIEGRSGVIDIDTAHIDVRNSGTSARFLTALCALSSKGTYYFDGTPAMRRRPQAGLLKALIQQGAKITFHEQAMHMPFTLHAHGLKGGCVEIDASASSQFISALLMVAPYAQSPLRLQLSTNNIRRSYIDMTLAMMEHFSQLEPIITVAKQDHYLVQQGKYYAHSDPYHIEGDVSAASYFMALPLLVGGKIRLQNIHPQSLQGDLLFLEHLQEAGLQTQWDEQGLCCSYHQKYQPTSITANFHAYSDTFLTVAAIAPYLRGVTTLSGLAHTRHQECDRLAVMAQNLRILGQKVQETQNSITITPAPLREGIIMTAHDHRVAMSFAILGCLDMQGNATPWLHIQDPMCCRKTFPLFFETLDQLYLSSHSLSQSN